MPWDQCPGTANFIENIGLDGRDHGLGAAHLLDNGGAGATGISSQIVTVFDEEKLLQYENAWQEHIDAAFGLYAARSPSPSEVETHKANILAEWNDIGDLVTEMLAELEG